MVRHVIVWTLKDEYSESEKETIKAGIKEGLEALIDKVPGIVEIKVYTEPLPSSNCDVMLDSLFVDQAALEGYQNHPAHVAVATSKVRPYTAARTCMDYEV